MSRGVELEHPPGRVLIVDDEVHNRDALLVMLQPEGLRLSTAASGEEALASVAQQAPDLILLDIMMPRMDGYEVALALKNDPTTKNIPIIMVTALDDRDARLRALSAGAEEFLSMPVDRAELSVRVRNLLRLKAYGDYHDKYSQMLEGEVGSRSAELVASERLYRSTFDFAAVGIAHVGLDGRWLQVNQRLCELLGYSQTELQTVEVQQCSAAERDACEQMAAGTMDRYVLDEKEFRRKDGTPLWARVSRSVHRDTTGKPLHFICIIEDITERRRLEAQLRQAGKMEAVGRLAAGVAHDFNNLLSVVLSYSELAAEALKPNDPARADLAEITRAGLRAVDLTKQLLAFSRQQVLLPNIVDLGEVVAGMEAMLRRLIGADVELGVTSGAPLAKVLIDRGQLEQVVMNLVVNARDAMPRGGMITIETTDVVLDAAYARDHGCKPGPHVMLAVSDTGTGMDKVTLARMFEPFFTTKAVGKGTGLGLATVFGIVRQSGGTIWVYSEPGQGTTFKVYLPVATEPGVPVAAPAPKEALGLRGGETILLVEDEEQVRVLAHTILRRYGYHVLEAQSGGDALLLCEQHSATIHLLLTDVVMPRMSGRQLAERLQSVRPAMKVLYMSGYTDDAVVRHGILDSTIAFVQKPITPETLAGKVREVLGPPA